MTQSPVKTTVGTSRPKKPKAGGRVAGTPNKATADARQAIGLFVDKNAHRLQKWLDAVADGEPRLDANGAQVRREDGSPVWVVPPNPEKAFTLFNGVIEYHVPKLQRSDVTHSGTVSFEAMVKALAEES